MTVRLLTPAGRGAVAVVEVSGAGARERVAALAGEGSPERGAFGLAHLVQGGEALDEALVVAREDGAIELHLHGSPAVVERVMRALGVARESGAGLEGRPGDTHEARALAALAHAPCEAAARVLLDQAEGALRRECAALRAGPESVLRHGVATLAERARVARRLFAPARVVLAGPVNAGKSTLFNTLLAEGRAIVSDERGTTRDVLVERARLGPWPVSLVDTAGERSDLGLGALERVEREGQRRGRAQRERADLVLWLEPVGSAGAVPAGATRLATQADRAPGGGGARAISGAISALRDPEGARRRVEALFLAALHLPPGDPWSPGAAVPFEPENERDLAGLATRPAAEIRSALMALCG